MAARWKHLKIFKLMRKLLPPLSHDKRWCKVCSWWVLIHSCVYISLILFCFQTHYWSIDQAIRRDKNWMLPALTILNALSSCLADADSSVPPNLGQATTFFFPDAVHSLQYSEFYFGKPAWAKQTIPADINGYYWCCLSMDPWYKGRAFVFVEKLKILVCY